MLQTDSDKRSYPLVLAASVRNVKKKLMTTPKLMSLPSAEANLGAYLYTKNSFISCNERSGNLGVMFCHMSVLVKIVVVITMSCAN